MPTLISKIWYGARHNMKNNAKDIKQRARKIKLLLMDVDGVLTPGYMVVEDSGRQVKIFDVQDGFGIMLWHKAGLKSAIITSGKTPAITRRAGMLNIDRVYQNVKDKLDFYHKLKKEFGLRDDQVCFIGDDLIDLPVLKRAGFSCSVNDSHNAIQPYVHYRCKSKGGRGAVREVIDIILKSKRLWSKVTKDYYK
jgi:3-deoxy-D-manno-octulosonate 8-phosphate phosphatase (KDO 8-P phosphatase)